MKSEAITFKGREDQLRYCITKVEDLSSYCKLLYGITSNGPLHLLLKSAFRTLRFSHLNTKANVGTDSVRNDVLGNDVLGKMF